MLAQDAREGLLEVLTELHPTTVGSTTTGGW
jgi:hypothetical protein